MIDEIVGLPIPSEEDVDAILHAVEAKMTWEEIERRIIAAQPHPQPPADHFLILAPGTAIKEPSQESYLKRFCAEHGNPVVADLIARNQIAQIKRLPKNMQVFVRSREAARKLSNQWVHFFGGQYKFLPWNPLADYFFIDIHGVENTTYMECLRSTFYQLGSRPIYDTYTHVTTSGIAAGTRRFYFASKECPLPLRVDGLPIDQLIIHDRKFTVQCKGVRTFNTGRGTRALDVSKYYDALTGIRPQPKKTTSTNGTSSQGTSNSKPTGVLPSPVTTRTSPPTHEPVADPPTSSPSPSSDSTDSESSPEPSSEEPSEPEALSTSTNKTLNNSPSGASSSKGEWETAGKHGTEVNMHDGKCGKRKHGAEVEEETGPTISRFASPNYFQVFQDSDIDLEFVDLDEESNYFYQAQPTKVIPARHGKEHVILLRRDGAGVGKKKKPDSIKATFKSMKADCDNVPISGSRSAADLFNTGTPQVLTHGSNGDNILKHIRTDPATACGQLSLLMQEQAMSCVWTWAALQYMGVSFSRRRKLRRVRAIALEGSPKACANKSTLDSFLTAPFDSSRDVRWHLPESYASIKTSRDGIEAFLTASSVRFGQESQSVVK